MSLISYHHLHVTQTNALDCMVSQSAEWLLNYCTSIKNWTSNTSVLEVIFLVEYQAYKIREP
jgi:hypothetical protein